MKKKRLDISFTQIEIEMTVVAPWPSLVPSPYSISWTGYNPKMCCRVGIML